MTTAADLIKTSLRTIGAIASGETPTAAEQADALEILNDILESWSNDGFMIFEESEQEFDLVAGQSTYTIGPGAALDTTRPQIILDAKVKSVNGGESSIAVVNSQQWFSSTRQPITASIPRGLHYQPSYPNAMIVLSPTPEAGSKLILRSLKALSGFTTAATVISFPPGYKLALRYALAAACAPEFGVQLNPEIKEQAMKAKLGIQRANTAPVVMQSDALGLSQRSGFYRGDPTE